MTLLGRSAAAAGNLRRACGSETIGARRPKKTSSASSAEKAGRMAQRPGWRTLVFVLSILTAACSKPHSEDPYWRESDALFQKFLASPSDSTEPTRAQKDLQKLVRIRRQLALMRHPQWANEYHDRLLDYMRADIEVSSLNQWYAAHLNSLQDAVKPAAGPGPVLPGEQERIREARKSFNERQKQDARASFDAMTELRKQLSGPAWPIPVMRTPFARRTPQRVTGTR